MIKVKISDLQNALPALQILANTKTSFKVSYDISKRLKAIDAELKEVEETRVKIIKELSGGKMKEDGAEFDLGENMDEFLRQYKELLDSEVELNILPLNIDSLANIEIEPAHLVNITFLLEEPKSEVKDDK